MYPLVIIDERYWSIFGFKCIRCFHVEVHVINPICFVVVVREDRHSEHALRKQFFEVARFLAAAPQDIVYGFHSHHFVRDFSANQDILFVLPNRRQVSGPQFQTEMFDRRLRVKSESLFS